MSGRPPDRPPAGAAQAIVAQLLATAEGRARLAAALARYIWAQEQEEARLKALRQVDR